MTTDDVLPRAFLPSLLLVALDGGSSHGYEISASLRAMGLQVDLASIYRGLRSMERRELVASSWEPSESGPDRRVYELTEAGRAELDDAVAWLKAVRRSLDHVLAADGRPA